MNPVFFQVVGVVAPSGTLCWCRLTYPSTGATAVEFPLTEETNTANQGLSIFAGSSTATIDDKFVGQLVLTVRQVTALNSAAYNASATVRATGTYDRVFSGQAPQSRNRMQTATDRLMRAFQRNAGVPITYTRGPFSIDNIIATVSRTPYEVVSGDVMIAKETRDYIVARADLEISGTQIIPASGDRITDPDGQVFEVSAPKPNNVYEAIGPNGSVFKIHTMGPK